MTSPTYDPYDPDVPEDFSDTLNISQDDILNNFSKIFTDFALNHVSLDAGATSGNHTYMQLLEQFQSPPQTDVGEISLYSKQVVNSNGDEEQTDQVFIRLQGNGQEIQMTNWQIYTIDSDPFPSRFFTFLPGKTIVYFGRINSLRASEFIFDFVPSPIKSLLAASFCPVTENPPVSLVAVLKPWVSIIENNDKTINKMIIRPSISSLLMPSYYYLFVCNI